MATYIKTPSKICLICSKQFSRPPRCGLKIFEKAKYCSIPCRSKQVFSLESRKRKAESYMKNPNRYYRFPKGVKPWNWKEDRSQIKVGDRQLHDPRYKEWHKAVKNRDGWKCKISNGDCSGRLEAHHILPWSSHPELRYEVNNGIALCHFHHPRKRADEMKLSPFFQSLVASQE